MDNNEQRFSWQYRLDKFLRQHEDQLNQSEARLVFRVRSGDLREQVEEYLRAKEFSATVDVKLGERTSVEDGVLSKQAVEAIFGRAKKVFTHNQNPPLLRRGRGVQSLGLRVGDRLATLSESGEILEDALVKMAQEMSSIYSVSGAYGTAQSWPFPNIFEYLKHEFNDYNWNLPFPIVEALFKGEKFELEFVYDGINREKSSTLKSLDVVVGDPLVVIAYRRGDNVAGYEPYEGTGFKIIHRSLILPMMVARNSAKISEKEPLVCVHPLSKLEEELPDSRYEIRATSKGRLYVADFACYGGRTWASVGSWSNKTENVPDDSVAYQILKPVEKA